MKTSDNRARNSDGTYLHQSREVFQNPRHGKLQEVVVPQIEPGQVDPGEHARGEAPQQVGVEEQQLKRRHGVEGARIHLVDLVILEIQVPTERRWRYGKNGNSDPPHFCPATEPTAELC